MVALIIFVALYALALLHFSWRILWAMIQDIKKDKDTEDDIDG